MFNYFRCPGICPVLINNMVDVVNRIQLEPGKDFRLISVSFDPADTPELAQQKKANYLNQMKRPFSPDCLAFSDRQCRKHESGGGFCGIQLSQAGRHVCSSRGDHRADAKRDHQPVFVRHELCSRGCGDGDPGSGR